MPPSDSPDHLDQTVHAMRGLGVTSVVLLHTLGLGMHLPVASAGKGIIYSFIMPLFFFLSGWVNSRGLVHRRLSLLARISNRFKRLMVVYLCLSLAVLCGKLAFSALGQSQYMDRPVTLGSGLAAILVYPGDNPMITMWFLYALFMIQVLSHVLVRLRRFPLSGVVPTSLFAAALICLSYMANAYLPRVFGLHHAGQHWIYFYLGVLGAQEAQRLHRLVHTYRYPLLLLAVTWIPLSGDLVSRGTLGLPYALVGVVVIWALASIISDGGRRCWPALAIVADFAYEIYTMAYFFQSATRLLLQQVLATAVGPVFAASAVLGLAGPIILSTFVLRRSRLLRCCVLGQWGRKPPSRAEAPGESGVV